MNDKPLTIAILGGAGKEGSGLALRWGDAGHRVIIGSRSAQRASDAAAELNEELNNPMVSGAYNREAAAACDIAVLAVPFPVQQETALAVADLLKEKILIDVTVPLKPPKVGTVQLPDGGSAAVALQAMLGPEITVAAAFQNVSAHHLRDLKHMMDCDVLVSSDSAEVADQVIALVRQAGMKGWHAGPLANSAAAEALTSVLIALNRRYKVPGSGIRITGID